MSYYGRFQLGATVPIYLSTINGAKQIAIPDSPPQMKVFAGSTLVEAHLMPVWEKFVVNGIFRYTLFLGRLYSTGQYQIVYYYNVSGSPLVQTDSFEIVPGGNVIGSDISTYFYERPEANYIIQGTESGEMLKGRNPTV